MKMSIWLLVRIFIFVGRVTENKKQYETKNEGEQTMSVSDVRTRYKCACMGECVCAGVHACP